MPRKKKPKPFTAVEAVKTKAREAIGSPPATRREPDPKKKSTRKPKHKPSLRDLLTDE